MQKIDVASAVAEMPVPAAAGTPGYFTEGDPVAGTPATVLSADFMNMIMMEILNVVVAGGIAPSKTDFTQLQDAIVNLILGQSPAIGASGSISLAGGLLIVKWGHFTAPANAAASTEVAAFNFADAYAGAHAFPSACFGVLPIPEGPPSGVWNSMSLICPANLRSKTGFTLSLDTTDTTQHISNTVPFFWVAIGN